MPSDRSERLQNAILAIRRASISPRYAKRIRAAYHREYEARHQGMIRALVKGYRETGLPVPVLSACGRGTQEIRFTQLMRHFLDPREPHGLGCRLLEAAFGKMVREMGTAPVEWADADVRAEVDLGRTARSGGKHQGNALDLLIVADDVAVLLEQKILSAEDVDPQTGEEVGSKQTAKRVNTQLKRYSEAFEGARSRLAPKARRVVKVFLTPARWSAKDPEAGWKSMSHRDLISRFLTIDHTLLSQVARHNLVTFLWDLACGPLELTDQLRVVVPMLERVEQDAEKDRLGSYLSWRRQYKCELGLFMELLRILPEG